MGDLLFVRRGAILAMLASFFALTSRIQSAGGAGHCASMPSSSADTHEPISPTTGAAKKALVQGGIDLAVLDFNLGSETSLPIAEELVAQGTPVVMATGYGAELDLPAPLKAVPIVTKPYDLRTLAPKIAQAMRG